jgi:hypothetical protein
MLNGEPKAINIIALIVSGKGCLMTDTDKSELEERIKQADTISALDELRMDIVSSKSPKLLKMWQEKFWERKKKYSYHEVQALIAQQCNQARKDLLNDLKQVTFNAVMSEKDAHAAIEDYIAAELAQAKETAIDV